MDVKTVKNLLKKHQIRPSKTLGQNFLINESIFKKMIENANLSKKDIVLEIGPGIGNLTLKLAENTKKVITIEKDKKMCNILKEVLKSMNVKNIEIINQDILEFNTERGIQDRKYKLIANLPYYITSPTIRKFLEAKNKPEEMILMVQKEVAKRICSSPSKMSILAVSVQFYAKVKIVCNVSKKSFWPQPKVDSAVIKITPNKSSQKINTELFFKIVRAGFSQPRKQLINNLSKALKINKENIKKWLSKNKINYTQRAEALTIQNWIELTATYEYCLCL